ncbi:MAG: hypothetical protein WBP26_00940 [Candidatus Saccharimonadales bacterium]
MAVALFGMTAVAALQPALVSAEQVTERSLALSSSAPGTVNVGAPGSATNGQQASYTFSFKVADGDQDIRAWSVMFCTGPFGYLTSTGTNRPVSTGTSGSGDSAPCAVPTGFSALTWNGSTAATVSIDGVADGGTWTAAVDANRANVILLQRGTSAVNVDADDEIVITFTATISDSIRNPNAQTYPNNTFFGHMTTYSDTSYAASVDDGTVASATSDSVNLTARVQETLKFSVGTDDTQPAPGATCDALTGTGTLLLGDSVNHALSATQAYDAHSYFRVSTNAVYGTDITYGGDTLRSGTTEVIDAMATKGVNTTSTEQFGLGIDGSDAAYEFNELTEAADYDAAEGTLGTGVSNSGTAEFTFLTSSLTAPVTIASQNAGIITCDTGAVRYLANISNDTAAGIYRTSINYVAIPRY